MIFLNQDIPAYRKKPINKSLKHTGESADSMHALTMNRNAYNGQLTNLLQLTTICEPNQQSQANISGLLVSTYSKTNIEQESIRQHKPQSNS